VTLAMPGMLARMSALARNFSSAAMVVSTKSAIRERSRSIWLERRFIYRVSERWGVAAGRALAAVQSLISACRAVANCLIT
jgi:hypothetical protein